ncbi:hypothetical protein INT45_007090 [Circinella minor]|uniref:PB1 domain-containing protein n=1 Tax=Circinella minor TaxID=1195481 RepID=A0A8H7VK84_9FUNG|nr:hypothetical protein INT45_007090 [Circinella minor]
MAASKYNFKVTIEEETRKFSLPQKFTSWHTLCAVLQSSFQIENSNEIVLYYCDSDHDVITLSSDMELAELLRQPEASTNIRLYGRRNQQDNNTMAWVFAPEENDSQQQQSIYHDNKVNLVDDIMTDIITPSSRPTTPFATINNNSNYTTTSEPDTTTNIPVSSASTSARASAPTAYTENEALPSVNFTATFEQLGKLMDQYREVIQQNTEVTRIISQVASTITSTISTNTKIDLDPLESWLATLVPSTISPSASPCTSDTSRNATQSQLRRSQSVTSSSRPSQNVSNYPTDNLYPPPTAPDAASFSEEKRKDDWIAPPPENNYGDEDDRDPPSYEDQLLWDQQQQQRHHHSRMSMPPPPLPVPRGYMESSLYPPPPQCTGPIWARVLKSVGSSLGTSLGWNMPYNPSAAHHHRYYSPAFHHHMHHGPPPPPPPPPPPIPTSFPIPPIPPMAPHWGNNNDDHHRHHRHHYPHPHHRSNNNINRPSCSSEFDPDLYVTRREAILQDHRELKQKQHQVKKEMHQLRRQHKREKRAAKKAARKEKRKDKRKQRRVKKQGGEKNEDGYISDSSISSDSSSSSSCSSSSTSESDAAVRNDLAYRVDRLRLSTDEKKK